MSDGKPFRIAHISDVHCGGAHFVSSLMDRAIAEINEMEPDLVVCSGDLTTFGFKPEYLQARSYLERIDCESLVVIPFYQLPVLVVRNRRVHGVSDNGQGAGIFWDVARWWRARR